MDKKYIFMGVIATFATVCSMAIWQQSTLVNGVSPGNAVGHIKTPTDLADIPPEVLAVTAAKEVAPVELAPLNSTDARGGSGIATRSFDEETFIHTVTAEVPAPNEGKFYEGWLVVKGAQPANFFSTGAMTQTPGGNWVLNYTSETDYPEHTFVVITEETSADGFDNKPELHILEGLFE